MKSHWKKKERGQSIPIIAMMIVVLFAMVGLSVDVGNTYAEQRNVVRATDAAALAGMQKMLQARHDKVGDQAVAQVIKSSLKSNGLLVAGEVPPETRNQRQVTLVYLDAGGNAITTCEVGGCTAIPNDAKYIKVVVGGVVDTYFARVVGQQTLPVGSTAYAAYCAPEDNVFPLAVNVDATLGERFKQPTDPTGQFEIAYSPNGDPALSSLTGEYKEDAQYSFALNHITWRKLFLSTQSGSLKEHQLRLLSWRSENRDNRGVLTKSLTGVGTMKSGEGITEAAWPNDATVSVPKPAIYPVNPGILDQDEWLFGYGSSSGQLSSADIDAVTTALQSHIQNRDTIILPIVGSDASPSSEYTGYTVYRVNRLGLFRIANAGQSDGGVKDRGSYMTADLAYLGDITGVACLQLPPNGPSTTPPPPVVGEVQIKPTWKETITTHPPIEYQVVLDVSGSMVMDMNGNAVHNNQKVFCLDSTNFENPSGLPEDSTCNASGDAQKWDKVEERRIFIAKDAVRQMIDGMGDSDMMKVIAFSHPQVWGGAIDPGQSLQVFPPTGWSSEKNYLKTSVKNAGSYQGDPYLSTGTTPTPDALNQVLKVLQRSDTPRTAPNGQTYKRVVILITDGMANVFLGGDNNEAWAKCPGVTPHNRVYNMTSCQGNAPMGDAFNGKVLPLDEMVTQANNIKKFDTDLQLWVIGMSRVNPYGLQNGVASNSSMYIPANNPGAVYDALQNIQTSVEESPCTVKSATSYASQISDGNRASAAYPDAGVYGYVTITDATGNIVPDGAPIPIKQDPTINSGRLSWYIPPGKLPPGKYTLTAEVGYKGQDTETRLYRFMDNGSTAFASSTSFTVDAQFGDTVVAPLLKMNLSEDESQNICEATRP